MTLTRPPAGPPVGPQAPGRPENPGRPDPQRIPAARAASASPEYRSTSLPGCPARRADRRIRRASPCLSSTRAGPWRATWPPPPPAWSSCSWAAWSRTSWRTRSWPGATASGCQPPSASSAGCGTAGRSGQGSASGLELPSPRAQWRVAAAGPLASLLLGATCRGRGGHPVSVRRRPAAGSRGHGRRLDQRPAGCGQPRAGGGTGWRADRPSARVGALGRSHPRRTRRGPFRPGQRGDPHRRRAHRPGARSSGRPLVRARRAC